MVDKRVAARNYPNMLHQLDLSYLMLKSLHTSTLRSTCDAAISVVDPRPRQIAKVFGFHTLLEDSTLLAELPINDLS